MATEVPCLAAPEAQSVNGTCKPWWVKTAVKGTEKRDWRHLYAQQLLRHQQYTGTCSVLCAPGHNSLPALSVQRHMLLAKPPRASFCSPQPTSAMKKVHVICFCVWSRPACTQKFSEACNAGQPHRRRSVSFLSCGFNPHNNILKRRYHVALSRARGSHDACGQCACTEHGSVLHQLNIYGTLAMCVGLQNQGQATMDITCVHMAVQIDCPYGRVTKHPHVQRGNLRQVSARDFGVKFCW